MPMTMFLLLMLSMLLMMMLMVVSLLFLLISSFSLSLSLYSSKKTHRFNSVFHFCGYSYRHKAKEVDEEEVVVVKRTVFFFFEVQNASFLATWTKKMWSYETHRFDGKI